MFRTIRGVIAIAAVTLIDAAAFVLAVADGKVTNLLIGAAMVASSALIIGAMVDRRLGDAYDAGRTRRGPVTSRAGRTQE